MSHGEFSNDLYFSKERLKHLISRAKRNPNQKIQLVNLLKFKPKAIYDDGRFTELSGREAYKIYSDTVTKIIVNMGGNTIMAPAEVQGMIVGDSTPIWDMIFVMEYPSLAKFLEMQKMKEFQQVTMHRAAGLEGQLLIETWPSKL